MTQGTIKRVGRFEIEGDVLRGPADYMRESGDARLAKIHAGTDLVFNAGLAQGSDVETALLVSLQTDFAAWHGMKLTLAECRAAAQVKP